MVVARRYWGGPSGWSVAVETAHDNHFPIPAHQRVRLEGKAGHPENAPLVRAPNPPKNRRKRPFVRRRNDGPWGGKARAIFGRYTVTVDSPKNGLKKPEKDTTYNAGVLSTQNLRIHIL